MKTKVTSLILVLFACTTLYAQAQISLTFDAFPYQNFSNPPGGLESAEVYSNATALSVSYPFLFNEQRTQLALGLSWERREFQYRGFNDETPNINALHAGELSLTLTHRLNDRWSLLGIVTPGLASDLKGTLNAEDFNFQAVAAGIWQKSPNLALGFGAVYSTQFGEPIPLPALLFDWNNGRKLSWMTILPVSSEFWYAHSDRAHFGLMLRVEGNDYQGDPNRYDANDPQLRYSVVKVGPSARFGLGHGLSLQVDGGFVPYHRFEFFDGDTEVASFNVKESAYLRFGFTFGG